MSRITNYRPLYLTGCSGCSRLFGLEYVPAERSGHPGDDKLWFCAKCKAKGRGQ